MFIFIIKGLVVIHSSPKNVYINRLSSSCVKVAMRAFWLLFSFSVSPVVTRRDWHAQTEYGCGGNQHLFPNIRAFVALSEPIQTPAPSVRAQCVLQR